MKTVGAVIGVLLVVLGITFAIQGADFFMYKFWAPKYEAVKRDVFEQTPSYRQGLIQELQNMQFKYEQASDAEKDALRPIILRRVAAFESNPDNVLPGDLSSFVVKLKNTKGDAFHVKK